MRQDRAAFMEFFGSDEVVLPPAEADERLNACYRHRQEAALAAHPGRRRPRNVPGMDIPAFDLPAELADADLRHPALCAVYGRGILCVLLTWGFAAGLAEAGVPWPHPPGAGPERAAAARRAGC